MDDLAEWCQSLLALFAQTLSENLKVQEPILVNGTSNKFTDVVEQCTTTEKLTSGTLVKLLTMIILDVVKLKIIGMLISPSVE